MSRQREAIALLKARPELVDRLLLLAEGNAALPLDVPAKAAQVLAPLVEGYENEHLAVLALTRRLRVVDSTVLTVGSADFTIVCPRQIFRWALTRKRVVGAIVLAHNHPSGDLMSSDQDIAVTRRVIDAGSVLGVHVLDHLVFAGGSFTSMRAEGRVDFYRLGQPVYTADRRC